MKAIDRLYQYFDFKHIKPTRFEKEIGLSNGYFGIQRKRNADLGSGIVEKIINNCRDLSLSWLISGEGQMLISELNNPNIDSMNCNDCPFKNHINRLEEDITRYREDIADLKDELRTLRGLETPESKLKNVS